MNTQQIIAMGGGGFSMEPENLLLDRYVLAQSPVENPVVCFVPTASDDSEGYIARFYAAFSTLPCRPRHLSLSQPPADLAAFIGECDIFYVGGGNTREMLAAWRKQGVDALLRAAWERGAMLCGLSAGAICWFERGHSDSAGDLGPLECLGLLPGSCTPHYDSEAKRRPSFHALIAQGALPAGYALDDGAALHFRGTELVEVIASRPAARAFHVRLVDGQAHEEPLAVRFLGAL